MSREGTGASFLVLSLALCVVPTSPTFATDYEFEWANPAPQGNGLFAMDFEGPLIGYAVGVKGTTMRTTDGGQSWTDQTDFRAFAKDMRDVLVLGPGDLIAVGGSPGIFRSLDGGTIWSSVPNPSTSALNNIEVISGDTLSAVGSNGQVLRSTDRGTTWSLLPWAGVAEVVDQFWWNGQEGYVVGMHLARQTTNAGQTWDPIPDVPEPRAYTKIHFLDAQNGWLIEHFNTYRTTDGGTSWFEKHGSPFESPIYQEEVVFLDSAHRFIVTFLEGAGIWETTDDGLSWTLLYERVRTAGYTDIERLGDGSMVVCSSFGDLLRSTDLGQTWVNFTESPEDGDRSFLEVMTVLPSGKAFAGGRDGAWLMSTDGGLEWEIPAASPGFTTVNAIALRTDDLGLVGGYLPLEPTQVTRTTDGGANWTSHPLTGGSVGSAVALAFPSDNLCFAITSSTDDHVFRSVDGGLSWAQSDSGIPADVQLYSIFFLDESTGFLGGGDFNGDVAIWKTTDSGDTWIPLSEVGLDPAGIQDMHWMDAMTGVVGSNWGVFRTTDGGNSWTETLDERGLFLDFRDPLHGVVGNYFDANIWATTDGGVTWELVEYPWDLAPYHLAAVPGGFLACGQGSTVLRGWDPSTTSVQDHSLPRGETSTLFVRASPNPFDRVATLRFAVPEAGPVSLVIYDLLGRRIATLASGHHSFGEFRTTWKGMDETGRRVGSGVYFIRIEGRGFAATEKVVLRKP